MIRNGFRKAGFLFISLALFGCGDGTDASSGSGASSSSGSSASSSGGSPGAANIVINEISGTGEEWVEIVNTGDITVDLEKYAITDVLADGSPNLVEAARFQAGTNLSPGEYLLIVGKFNPPLPGLQTQCLMAGGPVSCYQAAWGISNTKGDKVFFLSNTDEILQEVVYPVAAAPLGNTYGRLPDGTGSFSVTMPTPGATNAGP